MSLSSENLLDSQNYTRHVIRLWRQDEDHCRTGRAPGHSHLPRRGRPGLTRAAHRASTPPPSDPIRLRLPDPATPSVNALSASEDDCVPTCREEKLDHTSKDRDRSQNLPSCCGPYLSNAKPLAKPLPNLPTRLNPRQTRTPLPLAQVARTRLFFLSVDEWPQPL